MAELRISTDELRSMREASRELSRMVELLERRELDKLVLTQRNRMRAVVMSVERYSEIQSALENGTTAA